VPEIEKYCGPKYPPSLLSLTLRGPQIRMLPHVDLDELEKLKRLAIIGDTEAWALASPEIPEINIASATKAISDLEYLEVHNTPITLSWLSSTKDRLRHLVLSNVQRANLPLQKVKLEHIQIVELLWFDGTDNTLLPDFQRSFDFPGLKYFSLSQKCQPGDLSHTLALAEWCVHMCDLEVFALRLLNMSTRWVENITPFDISSTYTTINQGRLTAGYPKRCLIHGLVQVPPNHVNSPSFHIEVDEFPYHYSTWDAKGGSDICRSGEALSTRTKLLCNVDRDKCFSETQETQRFWERYNQ
jgi:hypothetical protein